MCFKGSIGCVCAYACSCVFVWVGVNEPNNTVLTIHACSDAHLSRKYLKYVVNTFN